MKKIKTVIWQICLGTSYKKRLCHKQSPGTLCQFVYVFLVYFPFHHVEIATGLTFFFMFDICMDLHPCIFYGIHYGKHCVGVCVDVWFQQPHLAQSDWTLGWVRLPTHCTLHNQFAEVKPAISTHTPTYQCCNIVCQTTMVTSIGLLQTKGRRVVMLKDRFIVKVC